MGAGAGPAGGRGTCTLRELRDRLGIARSTVAQLIVAGFVQPERGPRGEYLFRFEDVVLLRMAHALRLQSVPPRRILAALARLRADRPDLPVSRLRLTARGRRPVVRDDRRATDAALGDLADEAPAVRLRDAESGQFLLDFELPTPPEARSPGRVMAFPARRWSDAVAAPRGAQAPVEETAASWLARGQALEAARSPQAVEAYRRALALDPDLTDAVLNLGALLCDSGQPAQAAALYEAALTRLSEAPELPLRPDLEFNLAIALEDLGRPAEALALYERLLARSPRFADAHYNAARLSEQLGEMQRAIRHLGAYRRLTRP